MTMLPQGDEKRVMVQDMFDRIAPRYDALNRLFTGGLDQRWRRTALDAIGVGPDDHVLDLACGTGDLCEMAASRGAAVVGLDFAAVMLRHAQRRAGADEIAWLRGDVSALPISTASVSVVTCGFALRNFVSLPEVFAEIQRVLAPAGRIALIDVDRPPRAVVQRAHSLYFDRLVPWVGGLLSDRAAYRYLPESTAYLPPAAELLEMLRVAGFGDVQRRSLLLGTAQILTASAPARHDPASPR
jgi:demethylmenaquinone methyltransferase/2-methoxy-6-polyprenyl-1,4-benzoquinol methylase